MMENRRGIGFWILIGTSALITLFLIAGQTFALVDYDQAVKIGLQESAEEVGSVGIVFAKGFAFGDTFVYIPLLLGSIIGLLKGKTWSEYTMFGSCAISIYWPIVHLYAIYVGSNIMTLNSEKYVIFPIVLSLIVLYGLWGMWFLHRRINKRNQQYMVTT